MFKDYLASDIDNVFINKSEHGETVNINGASVNVVQDKEHLEYRLSRDTRGLISGDVLFYISENEFKKIPNLKKPPRTGDALMYNSKPATLSDFNNIVGLYEIILSL